jgi:hypothetical protein
MSLLERILGQTGAEPIVLHSPACTNESSAPHAFAHGPHHLCALPPTLLANKTHRDIPICPVRCRSAFELRRVTTKPAFEKLGRRPNPVRARIGQSRLGRVRDRAGRRASRTRMRLRPSDGWRSLSPVVRERRRPWDPRLTSEEVVLQQV